VRDAVCAPPPPRVIHACMLATLSRAIATPSLPVGHEPFLCLTSVRATSLCAEPLLWPHSGSPPTARCVPPPSLPSATPVPTRSERCLLWCVSCRLRLALNAFCRQTAQTDTVTMKTHRRDCVKRHVHVPPTADLSVAIVVRSTHNTSSQASPPHHHVLLLPLSSSQR
jgi:hypothetical protein